MMDSRTPSHDDQKPKLTESQNSRHCKKKRKSCIVPFTSLQETIFEGLLDNLVVAIQSSFVPPSGPLPSILKVLQNLVNSLPLSLRDNAELLAATELNINAYEQSEEWSVALISATQLTLTELYSLSLLACVASTVKDDWVSTIRLAETNLAGISSAVPPAINGTVLSFTSNTSPMNLGVDGRSGQPTGGVIIGFGFDSRAISVTTNDSSSSISIVLADNLGGNNYAFSMPRGGTLSSMTASFTLTSPAIFINSPMTVQAQLCRSSPGASPYTPFTTIPGAIVPLIPALSGSLSNLTCEGSLTGLDIPLNPGDRLVVVFTASSSPNSFANPQNIFGTGSASLTIGGMEGMPPAKDTIIPFASFSPVNLVFSASDFFGNGAGVVGYGFSATAPFIPASDLSLNSLFDEFTTVLPADSTTISSISAYFGVQSGQTLTSPVSIQVVLYRFTDSTNTATAILRTSIQLPVLQPGTYTNNSSGVFGVVEGLTGITLFPNERLVMVFIATGGSVTGWASGGVSVI
ncbi:hypothetical protein [Paenibacillus herberti]|uniref:Uncharacterized protein n=1 Tax=Paenibacillus herberti TaxID=1619309 RepID=A0A229P5I4_9BACL|nr:hypothetical protein [Paenibacillus herberti]OXM17214.1 hypothetical protein CGZ75_11575 [Paenibacillus herberti]